LIVTLKKLMQDHIIKQVIPTKVVIGVTGHRQLTKIEFVRQKVREALAHLDQTLEHTPHTFTIISPLAAGADQLVAQEILAWHPINSIGATTLEAILPFSEKEYLQNIDPDESKQGFSDLLERADTVEVLEKMPSHDVAYEQTGHFVVHNCDILIAIWNEDSDEEEEDSEKQGGTGHVVRYARSVGRSIVLINPNGGTMEIEQQADLTIKTLKELDDYNGERVSDITSKEAVETYSMKLDEHARNSGLSLQLLGLVKETILPHFIRADILAQHNQKCHVWAGTIIYGLAAAAVATVTIQAILFSKFPEVLWLEVMEISMILLLLIYSRIKDWHDKWIEYRSLAEHLRVAIFSSVANVDCQPFGSARYPGQSRRSDDWVGRAFTWLWRSNKRDCSDDLTQLHPIKDFLLSAWIDDQLNYYTKTSAYNQKLHHLLSRTQEVVFLLTLIVAILHAVGLGKLGISGDSTTHDILLVVVIVFPAIGAAIAGIRMHHEYQRNADQYSSMSRHLSVIREELIQTDDIETVRELAEEAREVMLHEHQQWREVFKFRQLEAP